MLTRCPRCGTRFRVHPDQIEAAQGKVHCGRCDNVFPALGAGDRWSNTLDPSTQAVSGKAPPRPTPWSTLGWGLANLVLTVILVLQWLWWERDTLAADPDGLRAVQLLCRYAGCEVQPPRAPEQIEILERSLLPDEGQPGVLSFHLRMVNRAPHAQPYPVVELDLTDRIERPAGLRRFTPAEYLPRYRPQDVMEPGTLVELDLALVDPGVQVIGYQIDFY